MEIIKGLVLQFEYKIMTYYGLMEEMVTQDILKKKNTSSEDVFNELGKDGWELFAILQGKENCLFIFKRSKWVEKKAQEKQEKQDDNSNKVERKFKVGDWIVNQHGIVRHIEEVGNVGYQTDEGWLTHDCYEKDFHLWSIRDAKVGDVLYLQHDGKEHIIIYKGVIKERFRTFVSAYCAYNGIVDAFCFVDVSRYADIAYGGIMPATKEQCDLLFQKMKENGYEWDADKKELKKIDNHATWSEEDEKMFVGLTTIVEGWYNSQSEKEKEYYGDCGYSNWLQSLKDRVQPQPKKQWSEEDKRIMSAISQLLKDCESENSWNCVYSNDREVFFVDIEKWLQSLKDRFSTHQNNLSADDEINYRILQGIICNSDTSSTLANKLSDWLESLRPQNHWMPSKEQIKALRWVLNNIPYNKHKEEISALLDQIKDL